MNLVNELQVSAEQDNVMVVLRKARRLASKLGVMDIDGWLKAEQDGYLNEREIPPYRTVKGTLVFRTNGPVPVGMGMMANGVMDHPSGWTTDMSLREAMREVLALIDTTKSKTQAVYMTIDDPDLIQSIRGTLNRHLANQATFLLRMNPAQIQAIPEAVKDRVLDWACELERRGVHGENLTFSGKEREAANAITFNISHSKIEQLNNMGDNHKG